MNEPAVAPQYIVSVGGVSPAFLWVVNVHRAGEHDEMRKHDGDSVPCVEFDILREGSRLRIPPVEFGDLIEGGYTVFGFWYSHYLRTLPMLPRNPATTFTGLPVDGLRAMAERSMTNPFLIA